MNKQFEISFLESKTLIIKRIEIFPMQVIADIISIEKNIINTKYG